MKIEELKLRAVSAPWWGGIEFLLFEPGSRAETIMRGEVIMQEVGGGEYIEPTFKLSFDKAQTLMDDLWNCGVRPTDGTGSTGALKATQEHLKDMQKIAFGLLEKETK